MGTAPPRVAFATIWDGAADYACSLLHWCQHAQRLADLLQRNGVIGGADLQILVTDDHKYGVGGTSCRCNVIKKRFCPECAARDLPGAPPKRDPWLTVSQDCPRARVATLDVRLRAAVRRYAASPQSGCHEGWYTTILYKWWAFSLVDFALVVFADLDVQLLAVVEQSAEQVVADWRLRLAEVVPADGLTRLGIDRDSVSPVNSGLWTLAWPSTRLYQQGLDVLERVTFNATHGFALPGHPETLGTPRELAARSRTLKERLKGTTSLRKNKWNVPFGGCDQGFLFWMIFIGPAKGVGAEYVKPLGRCLNSVSKPGCGHYARHYTGARKPWQLEKDNAGRVARYLKHTSWRANVNRSWCAARFGAWASGRLAHLMRDDPNGSAPLAGVGAGDWHGIWQRVLV